MFDIELLENREWVDAFVKRQHRKGQDFAERDGIYRRVDGLAHAWRADLITREQMFAGRRYERDYDALHRSGKYRCTIWRFIGDTAEDEVDRSLSAAMGLRRARQTLTQHQRALCDAVIGEDILLLDGDLPCALDRLYEHYGEELGVREREDFRCYTPPILSASDRTAERIREALRRAAKPSKPVKRRDRGPSGARAVEEEPPELSWEEFLPQKESRDDAAMKGTWLAGQGVVRANREMRHLGVQAKAEARRKVRSTGVIRKRVRRKGNS